MSEKIKELLNQGKSMSEIALILKVPVNYIKYIKNQG